MRLTISINQETHREILLYCEKKDIPYSSVYRRGALELIQREGT